MKFHQIAQKNKGFIIYPMTMKKKKKKKKKRRKEKKGLKIEYFSQNLL
jgi:hypothetical protein